MSTHENIHFFSNRIRLSYNDITENHLYRQYSHSIDSHVKFVYKTVVENQLTRLKANKCSLKASGFQLISSVVVYICFLSVHCISCMDQFASRWVYCQFYVKLQDQGYLFSFFFLSFSSTKLLKTYFIKIINIYLVLFLFSKFVSLRFVLKF